MAITPSTMKARLLVQFEKNEPAEIGQIIIPVRITEAEADHERSS